MRCPKTKLSSGRLILVQPNEPDEDIAIIRRIRVYDGRLLEVSAQLEDSMRTAPLILLLAVSAFAQSQSAPSTAACGPDHVTFVAHEGGDTLAPAPPEAGKARVYFIQDNGELADNQHYTLKIGLDGAWVGAYKNNSVFTVSVEPGEHHVCANVQSSFDQGLNFVFAHFTAEAGKVYYFRTRFFGVFLGSPQHPGRLDLDQPDSDQAKFLIATYPESLFKPKK
jgi:hypothetical protein